MMHRNSRSTTPWLLGLFLALAPFGVVSADDPPTPPGKAFSFTGRVLPLGTDSEPSDEDLSPPPLRYGHFLSLTHRSEQRLERFLRTAILRYLAPRGYAEVDETVCGATPPLPKDSTLRHFSSSLGASRKNGESAGLDLILIPSTTGGHELHLLGFECSGGSIKKPNPDLSQLEREFGELLEELEGAPLGAPGDELLAYPLSYVQADRAVAILKTLGYPIIEYKKNKTTPANGENLSDVIFDEVRSTSKGANRALLSRPVIINLIDSGTTSLVDAEHGGEGTGTGPSRSSLTGGQRLDGITDSAPQQRLLIVYDETDPKPLYKLLERLQQDIDVAARQILIEALVIELDRDFLQDVGVEFEGNKDNYDVSFQEDGGLFQPFSLGFTRPSPKTLLNFKVKLKALVDRGQATVLSRPSVLVLDGRQARIKVGDDLPFTKKLSIDDGVLLSENDFISTGIILNLRPRAAFDNSEVTLQVETIISSAGPSRVLPDLGILVAPPVQSRQVQTLVRVANDTPFVIGGLIADTQQSDVVGLPGLSRVRWLRRLFSKEGKIRDRKEVIVVITPHIISTDDRTYTYLIPRDAGGTGSAEERGRSGRKGRRSDANQQGETRRQGKAPSIFDSFDADLFRNVYRLRSSDIFDLGFITDSSNHRSQVQKARSLAEELTGVSFTTVPSVNREEIEREIQRLLALAKCDSKEGPSDRFHLPFFNIDLPQDCVTAEDVQTFLTLFEGDIPGEEILVQRMMIQLVEELGIVDQVPAEGILFFTNEEYGLDPIELLSIPSCSAEGSATLLSFETQDGHSACPADKPSSSGRRFVPPTVKVECISLASTDYWTELRQRKNQAILLKKGFKARGRSTLQLLQSVLTLERLLDLNHRETFPRTLRAYHVGREVVVPTREDLASRKHILDCRTARLFYETLDYYRAFEEAYEARGIDSEVEGRIRATRVRATAALEAGKL
ncbi:MAG: hypothetical protein K0U98_00580 [Deltaproteobacteria bacterium]|nr:hypothetical protein [Deltaproteobacteria bacterium]